MALESSIEKCILLGVAAETRQLVFGGAGQLDSENNRRRLEKPVYRSCGPVTIPV